MDENKIQKNNQGELKNVRTYMTDMADTVRANEISVIKVALAEQDKKNNEEIYKEIEGTPVKKFFWFIGGLILILGAIYGVYFIIQQKAKDNIPPQIIKEESLISYDEITSVELNDSQNLENQITNYLDQKSSSVKNDSIKYFSITKDVGGVKNKIISSDIFSLFEFTAPSSLVRSLDDSYMMGTYSKESGSDPNSTNISQKLFLIFKTKDYERSYVGMLDWEKTMASDMLYLFKLNTKENKLDLNKRQWKDIIINNKDARILINESNQPILYYLFVDKNNLIITTNTDTIKEIVNRLNIKNIKPL